MDGLVTLRFDAAATEDAALAAWYATSRPRGRLYVVDEAAPRCLAWHETIEPVPEQETRSWLFGVAALEAMSFRLMRDVGDRAQADTPFLYIVHTDVPDDIVDEYNAWYDSEHLPRLVTVPGVVRARRYAALAGHPRYLTAYGLTEHNAFSSPAGLAARKTPWTEKMRALFSNTRRLMCRRVRMSDRSLQIG